MKHFNEKRELVEGPPAEFWDDASYFPTLDEAYHHWVQPKYAEQFKAWNEKQKGAQHDRNAEVDN
jgi:hypothetical protein